jgi:hypothetical protein
VLSQLSFQHLLTLPKSLHLTDRMARCCLVTFRQRPISLLIPVCDLALKRADVGLHTIFVVERRIHVLAQRAYVPIDVFAEFQWGLVPATGARQSDAPHAGLQQRVEFIC